MGDREEATDRPAVPLCTSRLCPGLSLGAYFQGRVNLPSQAGSPLKPGRASWTLPWTFPSALRASAFLRQAGLPFDPLPTPRLTPFLEQERQWVEICSQSSGFFPSELKSHRCSDR